MICFLWGKILSTVALCVQRGRASLCEVAFADCALSEAALHFLVPVCVKCQVADSWRGEAQKLWKKEPVALTLPRWSSRAQ